ncbi:hypothetical protein SEA_WALTZ_36 [Arthrobacter phage Waltz]|nr:hypothetical protein SEA_WALTZ_36 [Arthrobacter phage Waltz]
MNDLIARIARWWYCPILCGALGSASSLTLRKIGHPVSPALATALVVVAVCAAIALLLILLVSRAFKARSARLKAVAADLARAEQRARDKVAARYPKPSQSNAARLTATRDAILKAGATFPEKTSITEAVAQAKRTPIVPLNSAPNPSLNRGPRPTRNVGYQRTRPYYGVGPMDYAERQRLSDDADRQRATLNAEREDRQRRESDAREDALSSAILAATAMDAIISAPSYSAPDTSGWSSPSSSYDSGSSSSYDGGSSSSFDSGSFSGGDSGSF